MVGAFRLSWICVITAVKKVFGDFEFKIILAIKLCGQERQNERSKGRMEGREIERERKKKLFILVFHM